jgi:hypothetical protein
MRCSKCGSDNREGRKFCTSCGIPLVTACPKCGAAIQPDERFRGECGTALSDAAPAAAAAGTAPVTAPSIGGERRHLTVLFCDLVGSTEIAAEDPDLIGIALTHGHRTGSVPKSKERSHVRRICPVQKWCRIPVVLNQAVKGPRLIRTA